MTLTGTDSDHPRPPRRRAPAPRCALAAACLLLALVPAARTAAVPAAGSPVDSLAGEELPPLGTGTSWMIGAILLEQGDARGALPYLRHAWRMSDREEPIARAYLQALLAVGHNTEALEVADSLLVADPADEELAVLRVRLLAAGGRLDDALAAVDSLRARAGELPGEAALLEAELLANAGRPRRALAAYRRALRALPERRERIYLAMAPLVERTAAPAEAVAFWAEATAAVPGSPLLQAGHLQALVQAGRRDEALALARELDRTLPPSGGALPWEVELAGLLAREGEVAAATDILRRRREGGARDPETALWLGRLLLAGGNGGEALPLLEEAAAGLPRDGTASFLLGEALGEAGDLAGSEKHLREALAREPDRPEFLIGLLRDLLMQHEDELAASRDRPGAEPPPAAAAARSEIERLTRRAAALLPEDDYRGQMLLGFAWRALGDEGEAAARFEAAADGPATRKQALLQLSLCLDELGQPQRALSALERLAGEMPDDPEVANSLGYYLADRGEQLERAERLIRKALAAEPDNGAYLDSLGWVLYRRGRLEAAFDSLVEAANALPQDPIVLEHLGLVLQALDRPEEALRVLRRAQAAGAGGERLERALHDLAPDRTGDGGDER